MGSISITFTVGSLADADRGARIMESVAAEFGEGGAAVDISVTPKNKGGRPPKNPSTAVDTTTAAGKVAEAYEQAGGKLPEETPAKPARTIEELRVIVRAIAVVKGSGWLRPIFKENSVEKLSDMGFDGLTKVASGFTDDEIAAFIKEAASS